MELTWNYGTEKEEGKVYHDGNSEPQGKSIGLTTDRSPENTSVDSVESFEAANTDLTGFGHICVSVDDLDAACKRFEEKGVTWKKRLTDGVSKTQNGRHRACLEAFSSHPLPQAHANIDSRGCLM